MSRRKNKISKRTSSFNKGRGFKNIKYKKTDIADWEGDTQSKLIFSNWFEKNYKKINEKATSKKYNYVWKYFSKNRKELKEQLYYDRLYVSDALKLNMKQSIKKLEHSRAFITKEEQYWYNMVKVIQEREPIRYAQITSILNTKNLYNAPVQYDKEAVGFRLYGEKTVYLLYCKYDTLSPKKSINTGSDFELEVIGPNE